MKSYWVSALAALSLLLVSVMPASASNHSHTQAPIKRRICVFDIAGNVGPVMGLMKDWKAAALNWGLDATLVAYTSEGVAAADLRGGICDAALITGIRARQFNKFTGTTDSIGSIQSLKEFRTVLAVLANPAMAKEMNTDGYRIMGIAPTGAAYIFVDDKKINTLAKAAGKKVAVLSYDKTQAEMVSMVGATPIPSDITNFSTKFNNGVVNVVAAPLAAYRALELYKGMSHGGGIIDYPLMQITMQLVAQKGRFPAAMAQKSRHYFYQHVGDALAVIKKAKAKIPSHWWVEIPSKDKNHYRKLMQKARVKMRDKGQYSGPMLTLLRKVRCKFKPSLNECTNPVE